MNSSRTSHESSAAARSLSPLLRHLLAFLPVVAVFWVGACFVWNHFLTGPYLLDSGWFSALIYRAGFFPDNPPCANSLQEYFGLHVSLLLSAASLVSHLVPLDRIQYYCLFQGLIYAPLGWVTVALARARGVDRTPDGAASVLLGSLLFALNGQVLACLGYPHYEVFLSAGLCVMLTGFAVARPGLAWLGLGMAVVTREDGGFHAAAFVAAAWACSISGRGFSISRRTLALMAGTAVLASVAASISQQLFFEPAHLFRRLYSGDPPYAHITFELVRARLAALPTEAAFVVWPFVGTVGIAAASRDARYLLGWLAELPWFVLNLLAVEDVKSNFSIYTGFPFVTSLWWVAAYGQVGAELLGRQRWLASLSLVSALATAGFYRSYPGTFVHLVRRAPVPVDVPYPRLAQFGASIERELHTYRGLLVDRGVASWAVTTLPAERCLSEAASLAGASGSGGIAFFRDGSLGTDALRLIRASGYTRCGRLPETDVLLCMRSDEPLPHPFEAL